VSSSRLGSRLLRLNPLASAANRTRRDLHSLSRPVPDSARSTQVADLTVFPAPRCLPADRNIYPTRFRTPTMRSDSSDDDIPLARASHGELPVSTCGLLLLIRTVARSTCFGEPRLTWHISAPHLPAYLNAIVGKCHLTILLCVASAPTISPSTDRKMDKSASKAGAAPPGLSIRHGPVGDRMDVDSTPNGTVKRKSRSSVGQAVQYKEESDSEDGAPLVGLPTSLPEFAQTAVG
jgi:hypothetical protein